MMILNDWISTTQRSRGCLREELLCAQFQHLTIKSDPVKGTCVGMWRKQFFSAAVRLNGGKQVMMSSKQWLKDDSLCPGVSLSTGRNENSRLTLSIRVSVRLFSSYQNDVGISKSVSWGAALRSFPPEKKNSQILSKIPHCHQSTWTTCIFLSEILWKRMHFDCCCYCVVALCLVCFCFSPLQKQYCRVTGAQQKQLQWCVFHPAANINHINDCGAGGCWGELPTS